MEPVVYLSHPCSLEHDTGEHPERGARITAIEAELDRRGWLGLRRVDSTPVADALLCAVHDPGYVGFVERSCALGPGQLDVDTAVGGPGSCQAALHAAGGAVALVDLLLGGEAPSGFSAHRPPGHHAEPARAMGFCLFNNVAVAAAHALAAHGLERVLVLDWDVHHGNGTNDMFHASRDVLYASIHQSPLYPGTGSASDVGVGAGAGYTVNLPVPPGSGDACFTSLLEHVVVPIALGYQPQLVLVSAGYDAHRDDPLADCSVTEEGYAWMTAALMRLGADLGVPVGFVLEGGYDLGALARSVAASLEVIIACSNGAGAQPGLGSGSDVHPVAAAARTRLADRWGLAPV